MEVCLRLTTVLLGLLASRLSLQAAISYNGGSYSQNFDTLGTGAVAWSDNSTLPGWYLYQTNGGTVSTLNASLSAGTSSTSNSKDRWLNLGNNTDRAIGLSAGSGTVGGSTGNLSGAYGFAIVNNTGTTITEFSISFDAERWFTADGNADQSITWDYRFGDTALMGGAHSAIAGATATFTKPDTSLVNQVWLASPVVVARTATISSTSWADGHTPWLRWADINDAGGDHGMGIDNVVFSATAIPEPSSYALFVTLASIGAAGVADPSDHHEGTELISRPAWHSRATRRCRSLRQRFYSKNFDSLATNSVTWSDDITLSGWHASQSVTGRPALRAPLSSPTRRDHGLPPAPPPPTSFESFTLPRLIATAA